jgi:hypothetical protein
MNFRFNLAESSTSLDGNRLDAYDKYPAAVRCEKEKKAEVKGNVEVDSLTLVAFGGSGQEIASNRPWRSLTIGAGAAEIWRPKI